MGHMFRVDLFRDENKKAVAENWRLNLVKIPSTYL